MLRLKSKALQKVGNKIKVYCATQLKSLRHKHYNLNAALHNMHIRCLPFPFLLPCLCLPDKMTHSFIRKRPSAVNESVLSFGKQQRWYQIKWTFSPVSLILTNSWCFGYSIRIKQAYGDKIPQSPVICSSRVYKTNVLTIQINRNWALNSGITIWILRLMENWSKLDTQN